MAAAVSGDDQKSSSTSHLYTLYFIRHAEALHNQLEKQAQAEALARAIAQGHDPNSAYTEKVQEEARRSILQSAKCIDPPLSDEGLKEAKNAKQSLETLIEMYNLPPVQEVWVSPLQRTLMTADVIFPEASSSQDCNRFTNNSTNNSMVIPKIKVKKEIEERQTGLACDTHTPLSDLRRRNTYERFSLSCLRLDKLLMMDGGIHGCSSMESIASIGEDGDSSVWEDKQEEDCVVGYLPNVKKYQESSRESTRSTALMKNSKDSSVSSTTTTTSVVEDKMMLRERTKKLFNLLAETKSRSICLIGHKGYLRELEHGPLGMPESELFKNCEVRVYRLQLEITADDNVVSGNVEDVVIDGEKDSSSNNERETSTPPKRRERSGSTAVLQRAEKIASSVHQS